jgi:dienelactone hydrolase
VRTRGARLAVAIFLACAIVPALGVGAAETPVADLTDGRSGKIAFESLTPTGYFQLAGGEAIKNTVIIGTLRLPKKATALMPAMVIAHGSGGVGGREPWWTDHLGDIGVAAFIVDSFTPRGITETATDQTQLSTAANVADALSALRLLATHPRIDKQRIGVMGFSKGGQVALYTALEPFRRAVVKDETRFAAHVPLYPYCNDWQVSEKTTGAPMLILLGGRDDYTPPEPCRGYAEWFRSKGASVDVVEYPNAHHGFDLLRPPIHVRNAVTGRNCDARVDLDRFTVTVRATGEDITSTAAAYGRSCVTRGAIVGGDSEGRRRAPEAVKTFLRKVFAP